MNNHADEVLKKMRAGQFAQTNGKVLRTINVLRYQYTKLSDVHYAQDAIPLAELLDSVNYLHESGYIRLRVSGSDRIAESGLADHDWEHLEAKLTPQGINLLAFKATDELVKI